MNNRNPTLISLSPEKVAYIFYKMAIFLVFAHLVVVFIKYILGHPNVYGLIAFFNLDKEQNLPTQFSTNLLLLNSILFL